MNIEDIISPRVLSSAEEIKDLEPVNNTPSPQADNDLVYYRDYVGLKSRLLNDTLILCFDKKKLRTVRQKHPGIPIYFQPEIEELYPYRKEEELIKWVHACKKEFDPCWIVPRDKQTFRFSDLPSKPKPSKVKQQEINYAQSTL